MELIDKAALVAEIERIKKSIGSDKFTNFFEQGCNQGKKDICDDLLSFLDILEVKEVDLDKIVKEEYLKQRCYRWKDDMLVILNESNFNRITKHFFELGLKHRKENKI